MSDTSSVKSTEETEQLFKEWFWETFTLHQRSDYGFKLGALGEDFPEKETFEKMKALQENKLKLTLPIKYNKFGFEMPTIDKITQDYIDSEGDELFEHCQIYLSSQVNSKEWQPFRKLIEAEPGGTRLHNAILYTLCNMLHKQSSFDVLRDCFSFTLIITMETDAEESFFASVSHGIPVYSFLIRILALMITFLPWSRETSTFQAKQKELLQN